MAVNPKEVNPKEKPEKSIPRLMFLNVIDSRKVVGL
jgi:hypothetical protein